jgi:hypothetical protein
MQAERRAITCVTDVGASLGTRRRLIIRYNRLVTTYKAFVPIARFVMNLRTVWKLIPVNVRKHD